MYMFAILAGFPPPKRLLGDTTMPPDRQWLRVLRTLKEIQ